MGTTTKEIGGSSFNDMISSVDRRSEYVENRAGANVRLNNFLTPYTLDDKSSILNAPCGYSNGVYASLRPVRSFGSELAVNGDFATDSGWTKGTNWSIANGKATVTNSTVSSIFQDILNVSKKYKVTFEITEITSGSLRIGIGQNFSDYFTQVGTYTYYGKISIDTLLRINPSSGTNASIDNVSVKEVIDADFDFTRGSSATRVNEKGLIEDVQILSGNLVQNGDFSQIGSELVTNGDFATDTNWSKLNATISGGKGNLNGDGQTSLLWQEILTQNKSYKVTFTVSDYNELGEARIINNNGDSYYTITENGTFTVYFKHIVSSVNFLFRAISGAVYSIDNVSVKEVGQNWTFGTGWNMGNGKAVFDGFSNVSLQQDGIVANNKKYRLTYTILDYVQGGLKWRFGLSTNLTPIRSANGTYVEEITATGSDFRAVTDGATKLSIDNVSVIEVTDDTNLPRIDYTNGTGSLLLEPESTNLVTYSEDFSNATWLIQNATVTTNDVVSPDGTQNADKLIENSSNSTHRILTNAGLTISGNVVISVFAKKGERNWIRLTNNNIVGAFFNLENGIIGGVSSGINAKIENYNNGWYRCSISATAVANERIGIYLSNNGVDTTYQGDGTSGVYLWGAMIEQNSSITSYIPTSDSTVTRNADVCINAGSSDLINSTEGVLYAEIAALADSGTNRYIVLSDGTADNSVRIYLNSNGTQLSGQLRSGGGLQCLFNHTVSDLLEFNKIAFSYKQNDFSFWINGIKVDTDINGNTPIGLSKLSFDRGDGTQSFYGRSRSVAVFKEALTDEELAKITSTTQQEVFYEMRDKMLQIDADYYEFGDYTTRLKKLF